MKSLDIILDIIIVSILLLFVYATFSIDKKCGWNGTLGKSWNCSCLGIIKTSTDNNLTDESSVTKETYYCTGLNISCSQFLLSYLRRNNLQTPLDCLQ